jgi:hypothetical protein
MGQVIFYSGPNAARVDVVYRAGYSDCQTSELGELFRLRQLIVDGRPSKLMERFRSIGRKVDRNFVEAAFITHPLLQQWLGGRI